MPGCWPARSRLVWQAGKVLQVNALGYRDVDAQLPMQRETIFRIASMTKPVTVAAVALALAEEGKLALNEPVTRWLPELADMRVLRDARAPADRTEPARRPITFDDLMTHRSGLAWRVLGPRAACLGLRQAVAAPGSGPLAG